MTFSDDCSCIDICDILRYLDVSFKTKLSGWTPGVPPQTDPSCDGAANQNYSGSGLVEGHSSTYQGSAILRLGFTAHLFLVMQSEGQQRIQMGELGDTVTDSETS